MKSFSARKKFFNYFKLRLKAMQFQEVFSLCLTWLFFFSFPVSLSSSGMKRTLQQTLILKSTHLKNFFINLSSRIGNVFV